MVQRLPLGGSCQLLRASYSQVTLHACARFYTARVASSDATHAARTCTWQQRSVAASFACVCLQLALIAATVPIEAGLALHSIACDAHLQLSQTRMSYPYMPDMRWQIDLGFYSGSLARAIAHSMALFSFQINL